MSNYAALIDTLSISGSRLTDGTANASGTVYSDGYMTPRFAVVDVPDCSGMDAIVGGDDVPALTGCESSFDRHYVGGLELGPRSVFSDRCQHRVFAAPHASAFGTHVSGVVRMRSEEEMIGVGTGRIVAAVTDEQTRRNVTAVNDPRCPLRRDVRMSLGTIKQNSAVAELAPITGPVPAAIAPNNHSFEPLGERFHGVRLP